MLTFTLGFFLSGHRLVFLMVILLLANNGLRDGKTSKVFFYTKFCLLCDKKVIAMSPCFSNCPRRFAIRAKVCRETLKIRVKLILKCPRSHAITSTNSLYKFGSV